MYHPSRGGVRGGRDQFTWDDVKVDKHRENYLGHSIKAPVGRWQKGKDLHWYTRDKTGDSSNADALKEEIRIIKEEEEQAMREALGLAPKRTAKAQGNRLDKHEFAELVKRESTAEDLGAGHAEAAHVQGIGFSRNHVPAEPSLPSILKSEPVEKVNVSQVTATAKNQDEDSGHESGEKKRKREEKNRENRDKQKTTMKHERHHKHHSRDADGNRHKKEKGSRSRDYH